MSEGKCCNHDCNQGRDCPVRTGTHKPAKAVPDAVIAGALFDFCGYLTTLPKESAITASGFHDASPMVDALKAWAEKRRLELDEADVPGWTAALAATPEAASSGYQCADCKAPLRAGYTCDKCDSSAAEEVEATAPAPMVLPEPVTWLVKCSQSVKLPNESNAEDCEWLEEADEQGMEGSFAVYTEQQVRDLLATGGQAQELADTVQTVFNALQDKIDARGPISKGNLQYYVNLLREAFDAAPQAQADARDADSAADVTHVRINANKEQICKT